MGALLILLTGGVLIFDGQFAPWYPFLFALVGTLSLLGSYELLALLGPGRRPWPALCHVGVFALVCANWPAHVLSGGGDPWRWVFFTFVGLVLLGFLAAMASFHPPRDGEADSTRPDSLSRLSLLVFAFFYLGVLPGFLVQLRWPTLVRAGDANRHAVVALALAIFVPKCCDIGAYFTGRFLGRRKMAPVLSPKKTWEGLAGGLALAALVAVAINRLGPVLSGGDLTAACFGLTVGGAGVWGDLAESLIKRECRRKDASQVVPGFGGVLDVVDSIIYSAPVASLWLSF
jgi:phosphatidate cytidylyltransferase